MKGGFFFLALLFTSLSDRAEGEKDVHALDGKCELCHLNSEKGEGPLFPREYTDLCLSCHRSLGRQSHPVRVVPGFVLPDGFPLNRKGELSCITCHLLHGDSPLEENIYLLRTPYRDEFFCRICHRDSVGELSLHRSEFDSAHIGRRYTARSLKEKIDTLSIKCLNCHDGTIARDSMIYHEGGDSYSHSPHGGVSHPIGVLYRETGAYVKLNELDDRIKLFAGRVGCGSCHSPYSKERYGLVITGNYSALCLACHRK